MKCADEIYLGSHAVQGGGSGVIRRIAEHVARALLAGASSSRGRVASQRAAQFSRHFRAQRFLLLILLLLLRLLLLLHGLRDPLEGFRADRRRYGSSLYISIVPTLYVSNRSMVIDRAAIRTRCLRREGNMRLKELVELKKKKRQLD